MTRELPSVGVAIPASLHGDRPIATIDPDGSVSVDWAATEAAANEPGNMFGTIARVMIAIRDNTAKELK